MTQDLTGQVAIVTGGSDGIGLATAALLVRRGAKVVICGRRQEQLDIASAHIEAEGGTVEAVQLDVTDFPAFEALIQDVAARHGRLDMLVNNASTFYPTPLGAITEAHWDDLVGSNLKAPLFLSQAAAPLLRRTQGLILNIVDIHGMRPLRQHPVYGVAKAGLIMLTRSLARELGPEVRVNAIAPGFFPSKMTAGIAEEFREAFRAATPIDVIEASRIGSRPSRRTGAASLEDLRAIPWVFAWSQARFYLSGWYGVGSALARLKEEDPKGFELIRRNFDDWPPLRYMLKNASTSVLAANRSMMKLYGGDRKSHV